MAVSVFELFKIGIGTSSSHTVGPMRAAGTFVRQLPDENLLNRVERMQVRLFGSLANEPAWRGDVETSRGGLAVNVIEC